MTHKVELQLDTSKIMSNVKKELNNLTEDMVRRFWEPDQKSPWVKKGDPYKIEPWDKGGLPNPKKPWPWGDWPETKPLKYVKEEKEPDLFQYKWINNILIILAPDLEKQQITLEIVEKHCNYLRVKFDGYSAFLGLKNPGEAMVREILIPDHFDPDTTEVNLKNGVLSLVFTRKVKKNENKKLNIK